MWPAENALELIGSARKAIATLVSVLFHTRTAPVLHEDAHGIIPASLLMVVLSPSEYVYRNRRGHGNNGAGGHGGGSSHPDASPVAASSGGSSSPHADDANRTVDAVQQLAPVVLLLIEQALSVKSACREAAVACLRCIAESAGITLLELITPHESVLQDFINKKSLIELSRDAQLAFFHTACWIMEAFPGLVKYSAALDFKLQQVSRLITVIACAESGLLLKYQFAYAVGSVLG